MAEAIVKSMEDITFFAENFFTIINKTKREHIKCRKYQKKALNTMVNENRVLMICSRQVGKTTLMTIYALWLANFFPDQNIIIIGNNNATAKMIFEKIRLAYLELPGWIKSPCLEFNQLSMKLSNGSRIVTSPTTDSAIRGNTVSCLILDEFAFVEEGIADRFWTSVTPTLVTNPDAKLFISSTPNGIGNTFHSLVERAEAKKNNFKIEKVIWSDVPGRGAKWKKMIIDTELNGDINKFEQEYECKFLGSTKSPFNASIFDFIKGTCEEPMTLLDDGKLKIWNNPENDRIYTIGVDVSEGIGEDSSVVQVFDVTDLTNIQQVACYRNNGIIPLDFPAVVEKIAKMYGNPVLGVERNGCGTSVCDALYYKKNYPRFVTLGQNGKTTAKNFKPGILSGQNTKSPAITNMRYWLENLKITIKDEEFLEELQHFVRKANRTWGAEQGYHDDLIMSAVWALNVLHPKYAEEYFVVLDKDKKTEIPIKIANKFKYQIDAQVNTLITSEFADYTGIPVCVFGRAGMTIVPGQTDTLAAMFAQGWEFLE